MQHKPLIAAALIAIGAAVAVFRLRPDTEPDPQAAPRDSYTVAENRMPRAAVDGTSDSDVAQRTSALLPGSRWPSRQPKTTVSQLPSDIARGLGTSGVAECARFHGTWRAPDGSDLSIEPDGEGVWLTGSADEQAVTWECSRLGDIRVRLPERTVNFAFGGETHMVEQETNGPGRMWLPRAPLQGH